ncbi:MAG: ABC transporter ATP-binding protein, partial [Phycisphaerales bacterium]|nr:ABC transporter ATP-binding protein/permease [Phycisphaerae bacterium]NNM27320.1 ABC transporter ATP-binding protein [Phycisphaerales bacterium]
MSEPAPRESASLRFVRLLHPYRRGLGFVIGLLCLLALADMVLPVFLKLLVDDVFLPGQDGNWALLWLILPGMAVIYVVRNMLFYISRMRSVRISENVCFDLRKRLFDHLQQQSLRYYRSHQPGRISARLMDDTFKLQTFLQEKFPSLLRYFIEFQVLLVIVYVVNWRLALATTVVLPLHFWAYWRFRAPIRRSHSEAQEHLAAAQGNVIEKMLGIEVVKGFSAEERESRSFRKAIDASRTSKIRSQHYHFSQKVVADLLVGLGTVTLLGFGAWEVKRGRMTGGEFFMAFWYIRMLYPAVLGVISGGAHLTRASASADRVFEILDEPAPEQDVAETADAGPPLLGDLEWRDVSVAYEPGAPLALEDLCLSIGAGEHVAIVGPSGSGKSTLVNLLPRFIEPTGGSVLVDDTPIWSVPLGRLRHLFGIVFQEVFLFDASIEENLRYARPDASMDEVIEACRLTGAHSIIGRLPDGYYTNVGGSGSELSRGERQRIALARALIRDPQVLILDEATASLDAAAARAIMERVLERMAGRTVIMITHHMELLGMVDRVIAVNGGQLVYDGPPADLPAPAPARPAMSLVEPRPERPGT